MCNCGCGIWLCGHSEQSCHVAFPFRSHLLREKHLFVRLPHTVTAWQPRFHQREARERKNCVFGTSARLCFWCVHALFSLSLCVLMHTILCVLLQYVCECVSYENLMKPTGSVWLQYVMSLILPAAALMKPAHFWVSVVKFRRTSQKVLTFLPECHQNW